MQILKKNTFYRKTVKKIKFILNLFFVAARTLTIFFTVDKILA